MPLQITLYQAVCHSLVSEVPKHWHEKSRPIRLSLRFITGAKEDILLGLFHWENPSCRDSCHSLRQWWWRKTSRDQVFSMTSFQWIFPCQHSSSPRNIPCSWHVFCITTPVPEAELVMKLASILGAHALNTTCLYYCQIISMKLGRRTFLLLQWYFNIC